MSGIRSVTFDFAGAKLVSFKNYLGALFNMSAESPATPVISQLQMITGKWLYDHYALWLWISVIALQFHDVSCTFPWDTSSHFCIALHRYTHIPQLNKLSCPAGYLRSLYTLQKKNIQIFITAL